MHSGTYTSFLLLFGVTELAAIAWCQRAPAIPLDVTAHLTAAQEAERRSDFAAASREYEAILRQHPDLAVVRQSLAVTLHLQNRFDDAIAEFERTLKLDPQLWGSLLFLGMDYYKTNRFEQAIASLTRSIELNRAMAEPEARFWLGVSYMALRRPEEAIIELRRAAELRANDLEVLYQLTRAYEQAAGAAFDRIPPRAAAAYLLQAQRFAAEKRPDLARINFATAVRLRPDYATWVPTDVELQTAAPTANDPVRSDTDARALRELAALYSEQRVAGRVVPPANAGVRGLESPDAVVQAMVLVREGRIKEALPMLERAARADPRVAVRTALLRAYSECGRLTEAESLATDLLRRHSQDVDVLHVAGKHYQRMAALTLDAMIKLDPDAYRVHELQAARLEERAEYAAAIREYEAALKKQPDAAGLRYGIGKAYANLKQNDTAEQYLKGELQRNPYHALAHASLGGIYADQGEADKAIVHLENALRSRSDLNSARLDLCRAYIAARRYEDAIAGLQIVAAAEPDNDRVHYHLATAYSRQGRAEEAKAEMQKYQQLNRMRLKRVQRDVRDASKAVVRQP